jgi:hypothetical protein
MKGSDPEFLEATRLVLKFFPEARGFLQMEDGIDCDRFLGAMMTAIYEADYSCFPFRGSADPNGGLAVAGGFDGGDAEIYLRLLAHTKIEPKGRAVVIPDAIGANSWSHEERRPFVCHSRAVPERLREIQVFDGCSDSLFVFESSEAILVDHDDRIYWARSRMRSRR